MSGQAASQASALALVTRVAALESELRALRQDDYFLVWQQIAAALDHACPNWRQQGPTPLAAAVTAISTSLSMLPSVGYLAVRGPDCQTVFTPEGATAFEKQGYTLLPLYVGI